MSHLLGRRPARDRLAGLSERERDVLELMAEGRSNRAVAARLHINDKTVESHISSIFTKLDLAPQTDDHRRVLAVLSWLQEVADGVVQDRAGHLRPDPRRA